MCRAVSMKGYEVWAQWAAKGLCLELQAALSTDAALTSPTSLQTWEETIIPQVTTIIRQVTTAIPQVAAGVLQATNPSSDQLMNVILTPEGLHLQAVVFNLPLLPFLTLSWFPSIQFSRDSYFPPSFPCSVMSNVSLFLLTSSGPALLPSFSLLVNLQRHYV